MVKLLFHTSSSILILAQRIIFLGKQTVGLGGGGEEKVKTVFLVCSSNPRLSKHGILGLDMISEKLKILAVYPTKLFLTWYVDISVTILHKKFQVLTFSFRFVRL